MNTSRSFDKHRCVRERVAARMARLCLPASSMSNPGPRPRPPPARAGRGPVYGDSTLRPPPGPEGKCATRRAATRAARARTDEGTRAPPTAGPRGDGLRPRPAHGARTATPQTAGLRTQLCRLFGKRTGVDGCMLSDGTRLTPLNIIER